MGIIDEAIGPGLKLEKNRVKLKECNESRLSIIHGFEKNFYYEVF